MAHGTVNKINGKLSSETVLFVEWKIQDFLSLPREVDHSIHSPTFHFKGANWYLQLYPNGEPRTESAGYIDIYLMKLYSASPIHRVNYHLGICKNDGTVYDSSRDEKDFKGNSSGWGTTNLVQRSKVCDKDKELAPNGVVTFFCYLEVKSGGTSDASTQTELLEDSSECSEKKEELLICDKRAGAHKLAKNLEDLLLSKEDCDITLKVKNQEFQAHKAILIARSSVFSSMLRHEMTEKLSGEVNIPDCDPDAFQLFLIYLYTGSSECLSTNNVFNLYAIANKYNVIELKINCTKYMNSSLSVETVCDVISLSLLHSESDLLDMATDFFTKYLKEILVTVKWRCFLEENLTAANELLIKASKYHAPPK